MPYGNHSYLESLADKSKVISTVLIFSSFTLFTFCACVAFQELPLYCSGGLRFFWDNKFDHAMVAFLDCVQQFKDEVEKGDTGFCLPYRLDDHLCRIIKTNSSKPKQQRDVSST